MDPNYQPHEIEWNSKKIANIWGYYSTHDEYDDTYFSKHSGRRVLDVIASYVSFNRNLTLDFGCGRGDMLKYLVERGVECQGLEFSKESIEVALRTVGNNPRFRGVVYAENLPSSLPDESFDIVLLIEVIEHLFEDQLLPTFNEIYRLLRPGGKVVVTCPHAEDLNNHAVRVHCPECGATFHRWQHMRSVTPESLSHMLEQACLIPLVCHPIDFGSLDMSLVERTINRLRAGYRALRGKNVVQKLPHLVYIGMK